MCNHLEPFSQNLCSSAVSLMYEKLSWEPTAWSIYNIVTYLRALVFSGLFLVQIISFWTFQIRKYLGYGHLPLKMFAKKAQMLPYSLIELMKWRVHETQKLQTYGYLWSCIYVLKSLVNETKKDFIYITWKSINFSSVTPVIPFFLNKW